MYIHLGALKHTYCTCKSGTLPHTHRAHRIVFPLQGLFHCDIPSLGQIPCKIEMENVASSIVKGAIYFDLIKGALVGPHCLILWEYVWKRGSSSFKTWRLFRTLKRGKVEWQYSTQGEKKHLRKWKWLLSVLELLQWRHFPHDISLRVQQRERAGGSSRGWGRKERKTDRQKGRRKKLLPPPTPEIGFILNQNKSLSHKSQQLRLNLSRNCDEIYCGRWEKKKRIISGEALVNRWAEYGWHLSRVLGL